MIGLDELILEAGQTHVIPPREDQSLLERLRDPRVLARAKELLHSALAAQCFPEERGDPRLRSAELLVQLGRV